MKGLYRKKGRPVWWMSFTMDGVRLQRSTGTADKELAAKILERVKAEITAGVWFDRRQEKREEHTFYELADKYLEWCAGRQKGAVKKEYRVRQLLKTFGGYSLEQITPLVIERYQSERLADGKKPATINRAVEIIRHMFTKAADWNLIDEATLRSVRRAKLLKVRNARLRYLSREESAALVAACDPQLRPIVVTALNTGMRKGEVLNLRWDQVDLRHGFILLSADETKNGERREVPINATLRATLQGIVRRLDTLYVFVSPVTGGPYHVDLKRRFHSALKRAGITDFVFHDLRHTFASQLVMAGADLVTVKELLGHKDIKMTLRYAHLAPSHKVRAVEMLDEKEGYSAGKCDHFVTMPQKEKGLLIATL